MRFLGIDYGVVNIGISCSDLTNVIATGLTTLKNDSKFFEELDKIMESRDITDIVLGLPKNMDGSMGPKAIEIAQFKTKLELRYKLDVILQDERLTTVQAHKLLISNNTRRSKRKKVVDKMASVLILQSYLDRRSKDEKTQHN